MQHQLELNRQTPVYETEELCVCKQEVSSTGAPQGTVLSPFLYTLLTSDLQQSESWCLQKYSDDSAADRFIKDEQEAEYRELVDSFNSWWGKKNHLILNVNKTQQIIVGETRMCQTLFSSWRAVGGLKKTHIHLDSRLGWRHNHEVVYKKGQCRLYPWNSASPVFAAWCCTSSLSVFSTITASEQRT